MKRCTVAALLLVFVAVSACGVLSSTPPAESMALIAAGSFQMGNSFGDGEPDELPVHTVYVSAFYMEKYEVTKALWDEVAIWAEARGYDIEPLYAIGEADHPVDNVTWYEAVRWANARSEKEGFEPCYTAGGVVYRAGEDSPDCNWSASGYRLPTEAEWEKAARGGAEGHRFPWSDTDTIQHSRATYYSSSFFSYDTSPTQGAAHVAGGTNHVGSFAPNGYGLYDMAGNVWELCWDWYAETTYASSPESDPRGPASGWARVQRGGGWGYLAYACRVAYRGTSFPVYVGYDLGFRLVRKVP